MQTTIFHKFITRERAELYATAVNEHANAIIGACHVFANVARQFDGKVYNVKFWRALDEALLQRFGTTAYETDSDSPWLRQNVRAVISDGFGGDLYFKIRTPNSYRDVVIDGATYNVTSEIYGEIFISADVAFDGKRIKASEFERAARKTAEGAEEIQARFNDATKHWDMYMDKLAVIDETIANIAPRINPLFIRKDAHYYLNGKSVRLNAKKF